MSTTGHCVAFAYRPLIEVSSSNFSWMLNMNVVSYIDVLPDVLFIHEAGSFVGRAFA